MSVSKTRAGNATAVQIKKRYENTAILEHNAGKTKQNKYNRKNKNVKCIGVVITRWLVYLTTRSTVLPAG
jgi:hypothetical protein